MNILQINTTDKKGGAASIAWTIKNKLDQEGIKNSMFVRDKYSDDETVFRIPNKFPLLSKILKYVLSDDTKYANSDYILTTPEFKNADIVHCHNLLGYYFNLETLSKMAETKKVIWTFHDMWPITAHCSYTFESEKMKDDFFVCPSINIYPKTLFNNDQKLIEFKKSIYNKANFHIVTPSNWLKSLVQKTCLKNKTVQTIHNGINTEIFKKSDKIIARTKFNLPQNKKIVLFLAEGGKKNPFKGGQYVDEVISHFKDNQEILFVSVGGNHQSIYQKENVFYIPKIKDKNELAQIYSACDCLLNPTLADNLPTVVLESMSCGLPVVSFKTGGVPEIIDHEANGYLAEYRDTKELCLYVEKILNLEHNQYLNMSEKAILKIKENFQDQKMLAEYLNLYKEICNSQ